VSSLAFRVEGYAPTSKFLINDQDERATLQKVWPHTAKHRREREFLQAALTCTARLST
jgi:hypothetical protein